MIRGSAKRRVDVSMRRCLLLSRSEGTPGEDDELDLEPGFLLPECREGKQQVRTFFWLALQQE